ncbi:hypothetical protein BCF55_0360 [Hydrogenivirga caldilitoris]|uniref:Trimeric autotransporter adhesin n=1 Tax=Hydrogenivirga caldilitoris TaxID=246264 RepID=A0A497XMF0_9AQUI|nr:hypothetical protein [Hydrogenivirga caldilitoris]RLJ70096.1 hypothetical protein BCF55_0360 [Hydrogenivirga caldilitoris]
MSKKFLLSAVFSAGVLSAGALAGDMQVLNEEELEDVSAQGLQVIENDNRQFAEINGQNNNLDSVQLNDNAQLEAQAGGIINVAKTALNAAVNLLADGPEPGPKPPPQNGDTKYFNYYFSQTNVQVAMNHVNTANNADAEEELAIAGNLNKETQSIDNNGNIREQDNNNNSVQLNDSAQSGASGLMIENAAISAVNTGMNIFVAGDVDSTEGHQTNTQVAKNMGNYAEAQAGDQPIAVAGNAELGVTQNINNQYQSEGEPNNIYDQDNNNNSVQLNDSAQSGASAVSMLNVANSAYNSGLNVMAMANLSNSLMTQNNSQTAESHVNVASAEADNGVALAGNLNKQTQNVHNAVADDFVGLGVIEEQDNNNNSVQLNDSAQSGASALDMTNSAVSAGNTGMNVMAATTVSTSEIHQGNYQSARNFDNEARTYNGNPESEDIAVATNAEIAGEPGQYVHTVHATIGDQNNNNNSVQLNDDAQSSASALFMTNMAQSAVNSGLNLLFVDGNVDDSTVSQTNEQFASNHNNYATANALAVAINLNKQRQIIENCFCSDLSQTDQDNNMNSVQLNDNAQSYASGWMIVNAATSAVNSGTNLAVVNGVVSGSSVTQTNVQTSVNFSNQASGNTAIAGNAEIGSLFIPIGF